MSSFDITMEEFLAQTDDVQNIIIQREGDLFINSYKGNIRLGVFALGNFFVELLVDLDANVVLSKKVFDDGELLDKYSNFTLKVL